MWPKTMSLAIQDFIHPDLTENDGFYVPMKCPGDSNYQKCFSAHCHQTLLKMI